MVFTAGAHHLCKKTKRRSTIASKVPKATENAFASPPPTLSHQRGSLLTSSTGTLSPNEKSETEPEVPYTVPAYVRWRCKVAKLETGQNAHLKGHRVIKSVQRRPHRYRRHSSEPSSDSEQGHSRRVSFLHAEGTQPFLHLHKRYRSVDIKYFKQIFLGTFKSKNLMKLGQRYTKWSNTESSRRPNGMLELLRCFEVYGQAICYYAHPDVALQLQEALSDYRCRLIVLSNTYEFNSINEYHNTVIETNMFRGQDDPMSWSTRDEHCSKLLARKLDRPDHLSKPRDSQT